MTTTFSSLPIIDLEALKGPKSSAAFTKLSQQLYNAFTTTGFAYLINTPLTFDHEEIFNLTREFFALPLDQKMKLAKQSLRPGHSNTYRGYFPTQPHLAADNLKEGFEVGNPNANHASSGKIQKINLSEPNVWPNSNLFSKQERLEQIYNELQGLASQLLPLLAVSLGKENNFFDAWLENSLSTLRLLHYPPVAVFEEQSHQQKEDVRLSCTPHTDSGILTLLHQDTTGGLEVLNATGDWVPAPYVPGSIVVNIGDLMARVSGSRFTATMHRVRSPPFRETVADAKFGRFSVPFFFEPGESCVVVPVDGGKESVMYGEHVRKKMLTWVEFQEDSGYETGTTEEM